MTGWGLLWLVGFGTVTALGCALLGLPVAYCVDAEFRAACHAWWRR